MAGLFDALKQYIADALPGGSLNPEQQPVVERANYLSGLLDPSSQVSQDARNWHGKVQTGLMDQLAGRDTPEAEYAHQQMMNAASMGAVIRNIYHGTSPEAAALINRRGFDLKQSADGTVWFTENPEIGEVGAARKGGIVKRQIDDEKLKLGGWPEYDKYGTGELKSMGYDGLKLVDGPEGFAVYRLFNPNKTAKKVKD